MLELCELDDETLLVLDKEEDGEIELAELLEEVASELELEGDEALLEKLIEEVTEELTDDDDAELDTEEEAEELIDEEDSELDAEDEAEEVWLLVNNELEGWELEGGAKLTLGAGTLMQIEPPPCVM